MATYPAINPYNFIPFAGEPVRKPLRGEAGYYADETALQSGWIDVTLTVKTPLIIPDGSCYKTEPAKDKYGKTLVDKEGKPKKDKNGNPFVHGIYQFFRLPDGTAAIPGSSLRGMLRSMYEAASNSCLPFLPAEPKRPISQRTPLYAAFKDRGLLEYDKKDNVWKLWKAKAYKIPITGEAVRDGYYTENGVTKIFLHICSRRCIIITQDSLLPKRVYTRRCAHGN